MRKFILSALIVAAGALTATTVKADPPPTIPYYVYMYYNANNVQITSTDVDIQTKQVQGFGGPTYTFDNPAPAGGYSDPLGQFSYGGYWATPSFFYGVSVIVNSGYTATVTNNAPGPQKVRMILQFFHNASGNVPEIIYGSYVTIPGYTKNFPVPIPAGAYTYTSAMGSYDPSSSVPIPLVIDVSY